MFYTATFNQIRYMNKYILPLSICSGEPSWYHDYKDRSYCFFDKRGVYNGLVAWPLILDPKTVKKIEDQGAMCRKNCPFDTHNCLFKSLYALQLKNTSIYKILSDLEDIKETYRKLAKIKDHENIDICFMVYEQPTNPCSEREVIKEYFESNNIRIEEWSCDNFNKITLF